jgi:DNA-binding NarL/FixJ family response regulator
LAQGCPTGKNEHDIQPGDCYLPRFMLQPNSVSTDSSLTELDIKSVLLLDDDEQLLEALKDLLESHNFVVTVANNGVEGLREVMSMDFDVVLCDLLMPQMNGEMFYLAVQRTKPHLCNRFVFITGQSDDPKVEDFIKRVNGLVLFKPVQIDELVRMISLAMKRGQSSL